MQLSEAVRTPDGATANKGAFISFQHDGNVWRIYAHERTTRRTVFLYRCRTNTDLMQAIATLPIKD